MVHPPTPHLSRTPGLTANLGVFDGQVAHVEVNEALAHADKAILFGEQTRLPHFPEDSRLPKLHAGDPLVLLFWKVFKRIPAALREALLRVTFSITLVRGDSLLFFAHSRRHQALHIGCRRRTIYLPQVLLHAAENKGYDYWAVAEGVIYASWMLLDYLLLVDVVAAYGQELARTPGLRFHASLQERLARIHNHHRREGEDPARSELMEFLAHYRGRLLGLDSTHVAAEMPFALARSLFDSEREQRWAQEKTERLAKVFNFPKLFLFDRDIIHGMAKQLAVRRGLALAPATFADVLHDYRDLRRFDPQPLLTELGKRTVPKPQAVFLQQLVALGGAGLRDFFAAYADADADARELMHPLWMYLCSLSSDPAAVFSRVGRCRAIVREGLEDQVEALVTGIILRLDRAPEYPDLVEEVAGMGEDARDELERLIACQQLGAEDEWETFKVRKQVIVQHAQRLLQRLDADPHESRADLAHLDLHGDALITAVLADHPYRLSSDPSGVLAYLRLYQRSLRTYGPGDPDADYLLAAVLLRLDRSADYAALLERVEALGTPAMSALHGVFSQIPERDQARRIILQQARILWSRMLAAKGRGYVRSLRPGRGT